MYSEHGESLKSRKVTYPTAHFFPDVSFADEMFVKHKVWPKQHERTIPCIWQCTFRFRHDFSAHKWTLHTLRKSCASM